MKTLIKNPSDVFIRMDYLDDDGNECRATIYRGTLTELEDASGVIRWKRHEGGHTGLSLEEISNQIDKVLKDGHIYTVITESATEGHIYQYDADGAWKEITVWNGYLGK